MTVKAINFAKFDISSSVERELFPNAKDAGFQALELFKAPEANFSLGQFGASSSASFAAIAPSHVFIHVREGTLSLQSGAQAVELAPGQAGVIRQNCSITWTQREGARVDFCSFVDDESTEGSAFTPLPDDTALEPSAPSSKDLLVSGEPTQSGKVLFADSSSRFKAGIWASTPYHRKTIPFPRNEFMHLLDGEVTFITPNGEIFTFGQGDTFFVPRGWVADWNSTSFIRKFYCTFT
jgi:uncharacterized cupin superfamily protein